MKNAEKVLKDCLDSLKSIIQRNDTELLIADTGSDDWSKKIASAYTDKIFDFDWKNDFAAARNFCIEKSCGEWIFFIDTDEVLENPSALEAFLNSQHNENNYVFTTVRQYQKDENSEYTDTFPVRLFRKSSGVKYENPIYEILTGISGDGIKTDIIIKHNYIFNTKRFLDFDSILIKAYENDPENSWLNQKMMEHSVLKNEFDDAKKYGENAVKYAGENRLLYMSAYTAMIKMYLNKKDYYNAELLINKHIPSKNTVHDIPIYSYYIRILHNIFRYDDMDVIYSWYVMLFANYKNGDFDGGLNQYLSLEGHSKASLRKNALMYINSLTGREMYDKANNMLETELPLKIYNEDFPDFKERVRSKFLIINRSEKYEDFYDSFTEFMRIGKNKTIELIDEIYKDISKDISNELKQLYDHPSKYAYEAVLKLRYADIENQELDIDDAFAFIDTAMSEYKDSKDILYFIFKYKYPITKWTDKTDPFDTKKMFNILKEYEYKDTLKMAENYLDSIDELETLHDIVVVSQIYEIIFTSLDTNTTDAAKAEEMFDTYISVMSQYIGIVYNENVLNDDDIYSLPSEIVFAYFGYCAVDEKNAGNISGYITYLDKALKVKQTFNPIIVMLLKSVQELADRSEKYNKIKFLIKHSVQNGNIEDAYSYLNEYARINPNDPEINELVNMLEEVSK